VPAPTSLWTTPDTALFEAGDRLREDELRIYVLQNLQYLGVDHNHDGGGGDGGFLPTSDPKAFDFYDVVGGPFA